MYIYDNTLLKFS